MSDRRTSMNAEYKCIQARGQTMARIPESSTSIGTMYVHKLAIRTPKSRKVPAMSRDVILVGDS